MKVKISKSKMTGFRLSHESIKAIKRLSDRLSNEARVIISQAKAIEIAIFNAEKKSLSELLEFDK